MGILGFLRFIVVYTVLASAAGLAEPNPYFDTCTENLRNHYQMSEGELREQVDLIQKKLVEDATGNNNFRPNTNYYYNLYYRTFPDIQWKLDKDPAFLWVDSWGRTGEAVRGFLLGVEKTNERRDRHRKRLGKERHKDTGTQIHLPHQIDDLVKPYSEVPSTLFFAPIPHRDSLGAEIDGWYRGTTGYAIHDYVENVKPEEFVKHLPQVKSEDDPESTLPLKAGLVSNFRGSLELLPNFSKTFEADLRLLRPIDGRYMFTLNEKKTIFVNPEGRVISIEEYLSHVQGIDRQEWSKQANLHGGWFVTTNGQEIKVPKTRTLFIDANQWPPKRVYEVNIP